MELDYLIVGAGCAGLSLAVHLLEAGLTHGRVAILDGRTEFGRDRTWCSFRGPRHPFERCVRDAWSKLRVRAGGREVLCDARSRPYEHIPSDAFYTYALERIRASRSMELILGADVSRLVDEGARVVAETGRGTLSARSAFDSRPPRGPSQGLVQHFTGWFVRTESPVFDPATATLMDFDVDQSEGIHFEYVLPFSETEALVEDTRISSRTLPEDRYAAGISAYLKTLGAGAVRVTHTERGAIPMTARPEALRPSPRIYRIGVAGGLARPSTGFAFLAIQRFSAALAARLVSGGRPARRLPEPPPVRPLRTRLLDEVFLSHLARRPGDAPGVFLRLFERVPAEALLRFLSEEGSASDDLRVMRALPLGPFATEALRTGLGLAS